MKDAHLEWKVSIVDKNVDGGKLFPNRSHHGFDLIILGDVRLKDHTAASTADDLLEHALRRFPVLMVIDDDDSAALRKPLGRGGTDTATRPGD